MEVISPNMHTTMLKDYWKKGKDDTKFQISVQLKKNKNNVKNFIGASGSGIAAVFFHVKKQLQLPGLENIFTGKYTIYQEPN